MSLTPDEHDLEIRAKYMSLALESGSTERNIEHMLRDCVNVEELGNKDRTKAEE